MLKQSDAKCQQLDNLTLHTNYNRFQTAKDCDFETVMSPGATGQKYRVALI